MKEIKIGEDYYGDGLLCFTGNAEWVQKAEYTFVAHYQVGSSVMA